MKKNDVFISEKLKGLLTISSIGIIHPLKFQIEFTEHHLLLKLLDLTSKNKLKIKDSAHFILKPLYTDLPEVYLLNYALIKSSLVTDGTNIALVIYNPLSSSTFTITLRSIEVIGVLFNKKLSLEVINVINRKIVSLINLEVKFLIEQFLVLFNLLRDCLDPKKCENPTIEEILLKSYINGKAYYDKYLNDLKKNSKLKSSVHQTLTEKLNEISRTLNQCDNYSDRYCESDNCNSNNPKAGYEDDGSDKAHSPENHFEKEKAVFSAYASFDSLLNEFKLRTSIYIEETIVLFFQVVSIDYSNKSMKNVDKTSIAISLKSMNETEKKTKNTRYISKTANRSANYIQKNDIGPNYLLDNPNQNHSESTKTNSDKKKLNCSFSKGKLNANNDLLETPKFCDRTKANNQESDNSKSQISYTAILKHLNQSKKAHSFVPPTDTYCIFLNTSEIIHRKFFEIFFEEFLGKIFSYEKDKDNLIKLEALYSYFMYLRGLKNILFIEKNRIYFSNVFFMDDEENN